MRVKLVPIPIIAAIGLVSVSPLMCQGLLPATLQKNPPRNGLGRLRSCLLERRAGESEEDISDAEALLACWSYLKKRKRLGNWTQFERRKAMKAAAEPHFFLELQDLEVEKAGEDHDEEDLEERELDDTRQDSGHTSDMDEIWYGEFTSFPAHPSKTRLLRSQASKRTWSDPEFRKRWHEKRWGNKPLESNEGLSRDKKIMRNRVRALPRGFLSSPELASMTEEEIDQAILGYREGRRKQSKARASHIENQQQKLHKSSDSPRLDRDSLFSIDQKKLKDDKRKRSELAKKAYKTRLKNTPKRETGALHSKKVLLPHSTTPQDAIQRIEADLSRGEYPNAKDLKSIMEPLKMPKRKELLRKVLSELFDLRGRCVPIDFEDPNSEKEFVTQTSISRLGEFVINLLEKQNKKIGTTRD